MTLAAKMVSYDHSRTIKTFCNNYIKRLHCDQRGTGEFGCVSQDSHDSVSSSKGIELALFNMLPLHFAVYHFRPPGCKR